MKLEGGKGSEWGPRAQPYYHVLFIAPYQGQPLRITLGARGGHNVPPPVLGPTVTFFSFSYENQGFNDHLTKSVGL